MVPQTKPPFAYYGGKTTLAEKIVALLPEHSHYVEPFAGSLAVLLAKRSATWETVNDLDGDLMTFWRVLRDRPLELARAAMLTPHARAELAAAADLDVPDEVERARRVWVRLSQSRGNTMRNVAAGDWRYRQDPKMGTSMPDYVTAYARRIEACAARLKNVSLECRDALDVIREYGKHEAVCIYADPPYLGTTRRTRTNYRHEMTGDSAHQDFAAALHACEASVVISGYASPLYEELFDGWHATKLKGPTTLSGDTDRVEVLWSNRPLGEATLFDGLGA